MSQLMSKTSLTSFSSIHDSKISKDPYRNTTTNYFVTDKKTDLVNTALKKNKQWKKEKIIGILSNKEGRKLNLRRKFYKTKDVK